MTPELDWTDILLRLAVAAGLTGAIGLEREIRERAAGLRTHTLVGVGSALFTIVSAYAWGDFVFDRTQGTILDPTRVAAQIVTGIGFLGAGAIIRQGVAVRGLTTAAGLWVVAAIGMAAGAGFFSAALIATGVVLISLGPLRLIERVPLYPLRRGGRALEIDLGPRRPIAPILAVLEEGRAGVSRVHVEEGPERRHVQISVDVPQAEAGALLERLSSLDDVVAIRWHR